jgi:ADP-heptose:LPS heptosyltransferase
MILQTALSIYVLTKKIYHQTSDIMFTCLIYFFSFKKYDKTNNVLIVVPDGIGDNILRLEVIKNYIEYFESKSIYFLVSKETGVKELIYSINKENTSFIDFSLKMFSRNPFYRFFKIKALNQYNFSSIVLLYTIESRVAEVLEKSFRAHNTFFYHTDNIFNYALLDDISLFKKVTNIDLDINLLKTNLQSIVKNNLYSDSKIPSEYIVVGIGSSSVARTYPITKFLPVLEWLGFNNYTMIFLGKGLEDEKYYNKLISLSSIIKNQSINLIGKLSLLDSFQVLRKAKFFVGVESGLFNAASFLGTPLIVIYGGGHYGRFKHTNDNAIYVSSKMNCFGCNWQNCPYGSLRFKSAKCISNIESQEIISAICMLMEKNSIKLNS